MLVNDHLDDGCEVQHWQEHQTSKKQKKKENKLHRRQQPEIRYMFKTFFPPIIYVYWTPPNKYPEGTTLSLSQKKIKIRFFSCMIGIYHMYT